MEYSQVSLTESQHFVLLCFARVASRRVASRRGLSDPKIHSLPTSNFTTTALYVAI